MTSRQEAKALGLARYDTDTPCKLGHMDERYTESNACCKCAIAHIAEINAKIAASNAAKKKILATYSKAGRGMLLAAYYADHTPSDLE